MKNVILTSVLFLLVSGMLSGQILQSVPMKRVSGVTKRAVSATEKATTMQIGYCDDGTNALGAGAGAKVKAAICIPAETAKRYLGNKLVSVWVATGLETGKNAQVFLSYDLKGEPFRIQDAILIQGKWKEVVLEIPYELEDKTFYIGYQLTSGTNTQTCYPIGLDDGPADANGDFLAYESKGVYTWANIGEMGYGNICIKGGLEGENLPQNDLALKTVNMKKYQKPGVPFSIEGTVKNMGACPVNDFRLTYKIGNAEPVDVKVDAAIANYENYKFTVENISVQEEGTLPVMVTVSAPNGNTDEYTDNNELTSQILCTDQFVDRKVLLEHFTTAACGNCPAAHKMLEEALGDNERVIWVAHHAGYGTDDFTTQADQEYLWLYNQGNTIYAPAIMFDRTNMSEYGALGYGGVPAPGPAFSPGKITLQNALEASLNSPAFVTVNIDKTYNEETRKLTLTVSGKTLGGDLPGENIRLNVFLTEDGLIANQAGGGFEYVHNHVMRANLSAIWGDPVTFTDGQYTKTYTKPLNSKWEAKNMRVIAFLANYDKTSPNNCNVYNAEAVYLSPQSDGIDQVASPSVHLYPEGRTVYIDGEYDRLIVYSTNGAQVLTITEGDHFSLDEGLYLITALTHNRVENHKILIQP